MASGVRRQVSRRRLPGVMNTALAVILAVTVVFIAQRSQANNPVAVAEFAPQAQQPIKAPPQEQASLFGNGSPVPSAFGGGASPSPAAAPAPSPTIPAGAKIRHCVGDPPRQIEDPQSPPCVPYWSDPKGNGGATYKGVTDVQITICGHEIDLASYSYETAIQNFLNSRFEFYGRSIVIKQETGYPGGGGGANDQPTQQADAQYCDETDHGFAGDTYVSAGGYWFAEEMARRGLIYSSYFTLFTEPWMRQHAPYVWQYPRGLDQQWTDLGDWMCKQVVGHNAVHAGDANLTSAPRLFGIYLDQQSNLSLDDSGLIQQLNSCGGKVAAEFRTNITTAANDQQAAYANAVLNMKSKGVTSVICLCNDYIEGAEFASHASGQSYHPEWITSTYLGAEDFYEGTWPKDEFPHFFGVSFLPKHHPIDQDPTQWAVEGGGQIGVVNDLSAAYYAEATYRPLLLLAAGIQMAGPRLTPQTFGAGLNKTVFPNPPNSLRMGTVGFLGNTHGMTNDATLFWLSNNDEGPYLNQGPPDPVVCYANHGERVKPGQWSNAPVDGSASDPFFRNGSRASHPNTAGRLPDDCDSGRYDVYKGGP